MASASQTPKAKARLRQRAEALSERLPPLLADAQRVAATVVHGAHGRRRTGLGETFWQFRPYEPGDRPQLIDWRQTAKSDRVFVRDLEWEAAQSLWLWRDISGSMAWRSTEAPESKRRRAELLLLALASLLLRAGERVASLASDAPPASGQAALIRLALKLEREPTGTDSLPPQKVLARYSRIILFSDFLHPLEEIEQSLRIYAAAGVAGHLVQILDPAEVSFPFSGRRSFEGLEQEDPWLVSRSESLRNSYLQRLDRQQRGLADLARRFCWTYSLHRTDRSAEGALLQLYRVIMELGSAPGPRR